MPISDRLAGIHQRLDEIGQQQNVGVERQNPAPFDRCDRLVLGRGETRFFVVVDDPAGVLELFEDVDCAVSGGVVDDDDFFLSYFCASTDSRHRLMNRPLL